MFNQAFANIYTGDSLSVQKLPPSIIKATITTPPDECKMNYSRHGIPSSPPIKCLQHELHDGKSRGAGVPVSYIHAHCTVSVHTAHSSMQISAPKRHEAHEKSAMRVENGCGNNGRTQPCSLRPKRDSSVRQAYATATQPPPASLIRLANARAVCSSFSMRHTMARLARGKCATRFVRCCCWTIGIKSVFKVAHCFHCWVGF